MHRVQVLSLRIPSMSPDILPMSANPQAAVHISHVTAPEQGE